ncbi:GatB/YqeY domain-containing protein [Nisaea acidiphila]|uniref:GatB/YqeY domain-containing protein n=1 Tax=Nisaea acidiphila TaxID=1862145 RepID=A0A9J7AW78_9PROT|nr:GatB/YqeY domain-containing protein [Nisaea acidiphila]UUX51560.1 GatB/YqeY domain-containing protein [Nisaea acidiphila]
MMRAAFNDALKEALKEKDQCAVSTIRLILAALKDRDIAARGNGKTEGIGEDEILGMLQTMLKQRNESIRMYEQGGRLELAEQEKAEMDVIRRFMPQQLDEAEMNAAVESVVKEIGAKELKDMGRTMAALKEQYAGRMDFSKASGLVRQMLA